MGARTARRAGETRVGWVWRGWSRQDFSPAPETAPATAPQEQLVLPVARREGIVARRNGVGIAPPALPVLDTNLARRQEHDVFLDIRRMIGDSLDILSDRHEIKERADRFRCLGGLASDTALVLLNRMSRLQPLPFVDRLEKNPKSQTGHKDVVVVIVAAGVGNKLQVGTDREPRCRVV